MNKKKNDPVVDSVSADNGPRISDGFKFVNAFNAMPKSKVSVGPASVMELALNQCAIEPILSAFDKATEPPEKYKQYEDELNDIHMSETAKVSGSVQSGYYPPYSDPQRAALRIKALREKYADVISLNDKRVEARKQGLLKPLGVKLNMIPKSAISFEDKDPLAAFIASGLMICIQREKA